MNGKIFRKCVLTFLVFVTLSYTSYAWQEQDTDVDDNLFGGYFHDAQTGWMIGWGVNNGAVILNTTNGGQNWDSEIPITNTLLFSIDFIDSLRGYAAGYDGSNATAMLMETADGGEEWEMLIFRESFGFYEVDFITDSLGFVCGYGGIIMRTQDAGWEWEILNTGTTDIFRKLFVLDEDNIWAACGTSFNNTNRIYRSTDGGDSWDEVEDFDNRFVVGGLYFFDENNGIAAGNDGYEAIYRTTDGGANWSRVHRGDVQRVLQGVTFEGEIGIAVGDGGRVVRSDDSGRTWEVDEEFEYGGLLYNAYIKEGSTYIAAQSGKIFNEIRNQNVEKRTEYQPLSEGIVSNYPNPFNGRTTINFSLQQSSHIELVLYDTSGKVVMQQTVGNRSEGTHNIDVDLSGLPTGQYIYRLNSEMSTSSGKMQLLK